MFLNDAHLYSVFCNAVQSFVQFVLIRLILYSMLHNEAYLYRMFHNEAHLYSVFQNEAHLYSVFCLFGVL